MKVKQIDFTLIKSMSEEQQQQSYYILSKRANQRFRDIEKKGEHSYAVDIAKKYLTDVYNRNTFKQSKKLTGQELQEGLKALERFFISKTSTIRGIRKVEQEHIESFEKKGIVISNKKKFFEFLSSNQFEVLSKYVDSDQVIEDFNVAIGDGVSIDDIMQGYDEFLNSEMTFEQVAERRSAGVLLQ